MPERTLGYVLLALAMATVGTTVIASKLIAGAIPPVTATALRFAFALPILVAIAWSRGEALPRMRLRAWALLLLQAGAGSVGFTVLLISGLTLIPAADAGVVIGTLPAVSATFAVLVLGEKPAARVVLAIFCATAGVLAVSWKGSGPGSPVGILLVLGAVVCESAFILLQKRMAVPLRPTLQAAVMTGLGLALTGPFAILEAPALPLPPSAIGAVVWYALVPTVGGFLLWYAGAARVAGTEAAIFTAVAPVTAVVLAAVLLGEPVGPSQIAGLVAVGLAMLLLTLPPGRATPQNRRIAPVRAQSPTK